jgi:universal stress protein E
MPAEDRLELFAGDIDRFERALRAQADAKLEALLTPHQSRAIKIRYETLLGVPPAELIRAVLKDGHDLVLSGSRGMSPIKRFVLGSTSERLVRLCPCPVWVVKATQGAPLKSVLVATDFSEASSKALQIGSLLATKAEAQLEVLHVCEELTAIDELPDRETTAALKRGRRSRLMRAAKERLEEFIKLHIPEAAKPRMRLSHGAGPQAITAEVRRSHADLLVMGSVGRTGIPGFFTGNTAEKVLRTCDNSILTVKPDGFVSPIQPALWSSYPHVMPSAERVPQA